MKFRIILICLIFIISNASLAQDSVVFDTRVSYMLKFYPDSTNKLEFEEEEMELLINDSSSLYRARSKRLNDSLSQTMEKKIDSVNMYGGEIVYPRPFPNTISHEIIKKDQKLLVIDRLKDTKKYAYEEDIGDMQWVLTEDTATIKGYLCQKATVEYGGRNWEAWFTTDIPIFEGPYKFFGLPGLIIKVSDQTNSWSFLVQDIEPELTRKVIVKVDHNKDYQVVNKNDFYKNKRYLLDNHFDMRAASGRVTYPSKEGENELRKQTIEYAEKDNNWIELF